MGRRAVAQDGRGAGRVRDGEDPVGGGVEAGAAEGRQAHPRQLQQRVAGGGGGEEPPLHARGKVGTLQNTIIHNSVWLGTQITHI